MKKLLIVIIVIVLIVIGLMYLGAPADSTPENGEIDQSADTTESIDADLGTIDTDGSLEADFNSLDADINSL